MNKFDLEQIIIELAEQNSRTVNLLILSMTVSSLALVMAVLAYNR